VSGAKPLVLVVDDDLGVLSVIKRFAEGQGFEVITCTDGRQALQIAEARRPDLVMVDLRMPDVAGLEIVRALRDADSKSMIVLMTGYGSIDSAVEAVKLGAADYLTKPFDLQRLRDTFAAVREQRERREGDGGRRGGRAADRVRRDDRAERGDAGSVRPDPASRAARSDRVDFG
jgi:DNA-binding NtrC family response regulator